MATSREWGEDIMGDDTAEDHFLAIVESLKDCQGILAKREKLVDAGFEFFEDEDEGANEIAQEQAAEPKTEIQRRLVAFFEGTDDPSAEIIGYSLAERESNEVNYALLRRYFRQGNDQLKKLILYGLGQDPVNESLLNDLVFFNEFKPNLKELVQFFGFACRASQDKAAFKKLTRDFYESTQPYGYDAFYELIQDETIDREKREIVKELKILYSEFENGLSF